MARGTRSREHTLSLRLNSATNSWPGATDTHAAAGVTVGTRDNNSQARRRQHEHCCRVPTIPREKQMMIRFSQDLTFHAGRFLPMLALLAVCIPAVAQQATVSAPLSADADEVLRRVVQKNEQRSNALESYSSIRS